MAERADAAGVIAVAIIEDQREVREGVAVLISGTKGYRCTASYRSMEEALSRIGSDPPDAMLVDIGLPGMSGIEGIRLLKDRFPNVTLLAFTVYDLYKHPARWGSGTGEWQIPPQVLG